MIQQQADILYINYDDETTTKDEKYGLERLEYAKKFKTIL
jgi:hypothetical protein